MAESLVKDTSYKFAVRVVRLYKYLTEEKREFILSKQLLRSGTSIGANVKEATQAESRADFIHKMAIALKEASETEYWLELLKETEYLDEAGFNSIYADCQELLKLLTAIIKSSKQNS
ncbi:MAG: four helix bundle protein [Acidobacteria bacterium]|nr:four helix bundle protein [Acidobacteriota bacterium]MBI3426110.1 four helix bundle protein [Acidobacteriota bacterium]